MDQRADAVVGFDHFSDGHTFFGERAGGTGLHTLAATGAGSRVAPFGVEVANDARVNAAGSHFPDVRPFEFRAHPDAAGAEDTAVVVEDEARMGQVQRESGIVVSKADRADAEGAGHGLQFTVTVGNANGTDMIAFDQQEFDRHPAVLGELGRSGGYGHAILDGRRARGKQAIDSLHFHNAEAAGTHGSETLQITKSWNVFVAGFGGLQNRLAFEGADEFAVDANRYFFLRQGALLPKSHRRLPDRSGDSGRLRRQPLPE